jgi:hypothetical protein
MTILVAGDLCPDCGHELVDVDDAALRCFLCGWGPQHATDQEVDEAIDAILFAVFLRRQIARSAICWHVYMAACAVLGAALLFGMSKTQNFILDSICFLLSLGLGVAMLWLVFQWVFYAIAVIGSPKPKYAILVSGLAGLVASLNGLPWWGYAPLSIFVLTTIVSIWNLR